MPKQKLQQLQKLAISYRSKCLTCSKKFGKMGRPVFAFCVLKKLCFDILFYTFYLFYCGHYNFLL